MLILFFLIFEIFVENMIFEIIKNPKFVSVFSLNQGFEEKKIIRKYWTNLPWYSVSNFIIYKKKYIALYRFFC